MGEIKKRAIENKYNNNIYELQSLVKGARILWHFTE